MIKVSSGLDQDLVDRSRRARILAIVLVVAVIVLNVVAASFALYVWRGSFGLNPASDLDGVRGTGDYVMFVVLGRGSMLLSTMAAASAAITLVFQVRSSPMTSSAAGEGKDDAKGSEEREDDADEEK